MLRLKVVLKCRMKDQWFLEHVLVVVVEGPVVPAIPRLQHVADRSLHRVRC